MFKYCCIKNSHCGNERQIFKSRFIQAAMMTWLLFGTALVDEIMIMGSFISFIYGGQDNKFVLEGFTKCTDIST